MGSWNRKTEMSKNKKCPWRSHGHLKNEIKPWLIIADVRYIRLSQNTIHQLLECHFFIQIDQKVDSDWPLNLIDVKGRKLKIYLKPGEMLLYESAKVMHGRQEPFEGEYFDNVFVHFQPKFNTRIRKFMSIFARQKFEIE